MAFVWVVDLGGLGPGEQGLVMVAAAERLQASLDLGVGPLLRAVLFDFGAGRSGRLLVAIHHLAVDAVSWRILLADLDTAVDQLQRGEPVRLPAKSTSFKCWAERLEDYARSPGLLSELAFWEAQGSVRPQAMVLDHPGGANVVAGARSVAVGLTEQETRALLQEVPVAYRTHINDVLLTALVQAWGVWAGQPSVLLDLEGHGREGLFDDVDVSRTVGWFTTIFPVWLRLKDAADTASALKSVKEQLRAVPDRGIGYGLLRYLSPEGQRLEGLAKPEVSFNYLGQLDGALSGGWFGPAGRPADPSAAGWGLVRICSTSPGRWWPDVWNWSGPIRMSCIIERPSRHWLGLIWKPCGP